MISHSSFRSHWSIDPAITFLNHGSFGACPIAVQQEQQAWRDRLERDPMRFFVWDYEELLDRSREAMAAFVEADAADLVFVPNATAGVNAVLRSLHVRPGDELLTTSHEYNASRNALDFVAAQAGAIVTVAELPFPIESADQVIEFVLAKVTDKTRLLLIDHVTSQTGLVLPIEPIISKLSAAGIATLVDGAHAPGMLPLNLKKLGATYYTGNAHKWLCAPKSAAFLVVDRAQQSQIRPLAISHGANSLRQDRSRFQLEFDWTGTADPSAVFSIPKAIEYLGSLLPGGWPELMQHNRNLAIAARHLLCDALKISPPCPAAMLGAMAAIPLPDGDCELLYRQLVDRAIQVQLQAWPRSPKRILRISAQLYNQLADYECLATALQILHQSY
ncbi:aminotransferase class V-fold PLP-dependent enzyme [Microcoleus sp. FACHB-1515]|uniref:aminotransferase class V-fold PLP-dependent enzyme n=1 Tax=Cyanophyceae TaxID=3028117 RepID=UPI0016888FB1|nr:aminotransferase class V-fold PLP-dependent enzyme [Microcoleus sp. FACHB-1515]MBD2089182.1 aminotransferase class V-fold PLP-dependent enzyme [Microcoleus sp. FACHB-1515]